MGKDPTPADSPASWFAVMEGARTRGDTALAARAKAELDRLGVIVRYRRKSAASKPKRRHQDGGGA